MKELNPRLFLELIASLLFMSGVPIFIKFTDANPITIGIIRLLIASLLMGILLSVKKEKFPLGARNLKNLFLIGFIFSIHWITYFFSIKTATASIGILGASTYGIHLIFLGWIFLKTKPGWMDGLAIIVAFAGTYIIIPEFTLSNNITVGLLLSIISGLFFAFLPILHQKNQHMSNNVRSLGQYIFALPLFFIFIGQFEFSWKPSDIYSLLYLGIFGTFLAHSFWINVTTKLPTTFTSLIFYIVIPFTMFLSYFWLDESMNPEKVTGAILIILANVIGIMRKFKRVQIPMDLD
ncbi:MAG: DMT family transporter [Cyclobacteriaceae bacterium]|nr:DMT family transporter [Cyclobacteriaceae bacterium]